MPWPRKRQCNSSEWMGEPTAMFTRASGSFLVPCPIHPRDGKRAATFQERNLRCKNLTLNGAFLTHTVSVVGTFQVLSDERIHVFQWSLKKSKGCLEDEEGLTFQWTALKKVVKRCGIWSQTWVQMLALSPNSDEHLGELITLPKSGSSSLRWGSKWHSSQVDFLTPCLS